MAAAEEFYLRYYVGHKGKFGHEFLEFEFRPDGKARDVALHDPELQPAPARARGTAAHALPAVSAAAVRQQQQLQERHNHPQRGLRVASRAG